VSENKQIVEIIYQAIDETNLLAPPEQQLEKSIDTVVFGDMGKLNSLGLVSFIVATEQKIEEETGISVILADEKAMSQKNSPFRTVATLAEYIDQLLSEAKNE